jgi:hypothetical protein
MPWQEIGSFAAPPVIDAALVSDARPACGDVAD